MEELKIWVESYGLNFNLIVTGIIIIVASLIIFAIIKKLFTVAIIIAVVTIFIPLAINWTTDLKNDFISTLPPETGQKVEQSLQDFQDETIGSGGILDIEQIKKNFGKK